MHSKEDILSFTTFIQWHRDKGNMATVSEVYMRTHLGRMTENTPKEEVGFGDQQGSGDLQQKRE